MDIIDKKEGILQGRSPLFCAKNGSKNKYIRCIVQKYTKQYNKRTITTRRLMLSAKQRSMHAEQKI
jgi:hypothetical protein